MKVSQKDVSNEFVNLFSCALCTEDKKKKCCKKYKKKGDPCKKCPKF